MNLAFLNPALVWGALAALLPLAIHLFFRRRPRPVPFPAVAFILRARRETERRLRLRRILLFAARTALLLAIALAVARPELRHGGAAAAVVRGPAAVALVLDASASMGYVLDGQPLFERARADLEEAIASLGTEEPATAVICGGPALPDVAPPTYDRAAVRRALRDAQVTALHADLSACVAAAARALADPAVAGLGKRVVVATDLAATAWRFDAAAPTVEGPRGAVRPEVRIVDAARGAALPNLAITALEAQPDLAAGARGYRVAATIANAGAEAASDLRVELRTSERADAPVAVRALAEVPGGGAARKTLTTSFPAGGPAVVQVSLAPDALAVDDARVLAVAVPRDARALVVNGAPSSVKFRDEAWFLEAALNSPASPVRATIVDADAAKRLRLADFAVVFLLNVREVGARLPELKAFVEGGGGLFVALGDQIDPEAYARALGGLVPPLHVVKTASPEAGGPARFDAVDFSHPALAVFSGEAREGLLGARTFRYALVKPERHGTTRVLAAFDDGAPALVEQQVGRGRVVLFTSSVDRDWSDWSIRTSFLPAMQRMAAYLAGALDEDRPVPTVVGGSRELVPREGQELRALVAPGGRELPAERLSRPAAGANPVVVPDVPGLWQVRVAEGGAEKLEPRLAFAAQPDPRESDTRRADAKELTAWLGGSEVARVAETGRRDAKVPLWSVLLAAALAAFVMEGLLAK